MKILCASAALALGSAAARAQLVYEPFAYPAGAALDSQSNPVTGQPWAKMSNNAADDDILITGAALPYPALSAPIGDVAAYAGAGKTQRLAIGPVISSGSVYYSMLMQLTGVGAMTTSPVFIAGFSTAAGPSAAQPTTIGTRLYLRQGASSTPEAPTFNIGVSKNSSTAADIAFDSIEFALNSPVMLVGSYSINGSAAGTDDLAKLYINPDASALGAASAPTDSTPASPILSAPLVGTDLFAAGTPAVAGFLLRQGSAFVPSVQVDELRIDTTWAQVTPPPGVSWDVDEDGPWLQDDRWSTDVSPSSPDAFVNFNAVISAPRTVTIDSPIALRTINFTSEQPYTLEGGGSLDFSTSAAINVRFGGSHTINTPITLAGDFLLSVGSNSTLHLAGDVTGGGTHTITKAGAGSLEMKNIRAGRLEVIAGVVATTPNGGADATSRVTSLAIAAGATLDLSDNDLVIDHAVDASPVGSWNGSAYTGVTGLIAAGRNGGTWDAPGIITSQPDALAELITLGVADAAVVLALGPDDTAVWSGQTVDATTLLVRYTYTGDSNLDGVINADDYANIDFNAPIEGATGYANGDFNYDGNIDADDYALIDFNLNAQGPPLGDSMPALSAVPEPGAGLTVIALSVMMLRRCRG